MLYIWKEPPQLQQKRVKVRRAKKSLKGSCVLMWRVVWVLGCVSVCRTQRMRFHICSMATILSVRWLPFFPKWWQLSKNWLSKVKFILIRVLVQIFDEIMLICEKWQNISSWSARLWWKKSHGYGKRKRVYIFLGLHLTSDNAVHKKMIVWLHAAVAKPRSYLWFCSLPKQMFKSTPFVCSKLMQHFVKVLISMPNAYTTLPPCKEECRLFWKQFWLVWHER